MAAAENFLENGVDVFDCHLPVPEVARPRGYGDPLAAVFEASCPRDHHGFAKASFPDSVLEALVDFERTSGATRRFWCPEWAFIQADQDLDVWLRHALASHFELHTLR